jgi:anti-anti-sigma factor
LTGCHALCIVLLRLRRAGGGSVGGSARVDLTGSTPIVHLFGEIDLGTADCFREAMSKLDGHPSVIIDLAAVTFFDSTGIGVVAHEVRGGRAVVIRSPGHLVRRALEIVGLDELIEPVPSPVAAGD